MFKHFLIANDSGNGRAALDASNPSCLLRGACAGEFPAEAVRV
jgi:hypothetical protein